MRAATITPLRAAASAPQTAPPRTIDEALARHLDALYATARVLCREPALAEDLVQDTALAAFRNWGDLREPAAAKSWLLKILHRRFFNVRRFDSHRPPVHDVELDRLLEQPELAHDVAPFPDTFARQAVLDSLRTLPTAFAEVAWLVDALELTIAEVADVLDIPVGTVGSRLHRARRMLHERLAAVATEAP